MLPRFLSLLIVAPLSACAMFGPPGPLAAWNGKSSAEIVAAWGEPSLKSPLANGAEEWIFSRSIAASAPGYWRDETRKAVREVTGPDGRKHPTAISETFPVWQPAGKQTVSCTTRFTLKAGQVTNASASLPDCAEPARKPLAPALKAKAPS